MAKCYQNLAFQDQDWVAEFMRTLGVYKLSMSGMLYTYGLGPLLQAWSTQQTRQQVCLRALPQLGITDIWILLSRRCINPRQVLQTVIHEAESEEEEGVLHL